MLSCLVDGCSMEATARIVHVAPNTVAKFLVDLGKACTRYQARVFENIFCKRIQCDEIWSFVGCKEKNVTNNGKRQGDTWTWIACDPDTKLVPCWFIGRRDSESAKKFMRRLARHLSLGSTQITTDGLKAYINAIKEILWIETSYGMVEKKIRCQWRRSQNQIYRERKDGNFWKPRPRHNEYLHRGTAKFDHENVNAPLHSKNKWLLQKNRKPPLCYRLAFYVLQLRQNSFHIEHNPSSSRRNCKSCLEFG